MLKLLRLETSYIFPLPAIFSRESYGWRENEMFEDFEARWKGLLTRASLKITEKLIVAIDKINRLKIMMQYSGCPAICVGIIFLLKNGFDITIWIRNTLNIVLIILVAIPTIAYVSYSSQKKKADEEFIKIRDKLIQCINADFCKCSQICNHKDEFLEYMEDTYHVELYM